jgi:hypothetical protein
VTPDQIAYERRMCKSEGREIAKTSTPTHHPHRQDFLELMCLHHVDTNSPFYLSIIKQWEDGNELFEIGEYDDPKSRKPAKGILSAKLIGVIEDDEGPKRKRCAIGLVSIAHQLRGEGE